jgi:hypothetical protein
MEFDNNTQIDDERRRLAEAKKLVLQPIHSDIVPESTANANDTSSINISPIANIESDTEQNAAPIQPAGAIDILDKKDNKKQTIIFASATIASAGLIFAVGIAIAYL